MDLGTAIRRWKANWMRMDELAALDRDQREAMARDIAVPADMLPILAAGGPDAGQELPRLMTELSLDMNHIRHIHAALMRDMSLTCSGCTAAVRCREDLSQGHASARYGEYCPNAESLRELQGKNVARA
ncbi:DUF6455 family protein [Microvirga lotononidis]|uniref:DUF6455 domain-containing protein n=1 Tax=Microvirga lotononidis TaxID=864069 RepID=I4YKT4_9HYPH|nr:DUF6455 family protein [Microvirga lotononidis]EIM24576.1 hypothetical protein MicloDRAFT_00052910 [Microvirga lotononidis]WQO26595.1 DUF6455 family protein [Microvirga lotononidis]